MSCSLPSVDQSTMQKQANQASVVALRLYTLYIALDLFMVSLYCSAKIYTYCYQRNPPVSYGIEFIAATFTTLKIVWICLLFRAFSSLAVSDRTPRANRTKSPQASKPTMKLLFVSPSELTFSDAKTNIIVK